MVNSRELQMDSIGKEATAFIRACESIHSLLEDRTLQADDQALIEFSAADLLDKLKSDT